MLQTNFIGDMYYCKNFSQQGHQAKISKFKIESERSNAFILSKAEDNFSYTNPYIIDGPNLFTFEITVYPQKQQSYGPYGYAAYPGPAAYYGSQYGLPYNQY